MTNNNGIQKEVQGERPRRERKNWQYFNTKLTPPSPLPLPLKNISTEFISSRQPQTSSEKSQISAFRRKRFITERMK